MKQTFADLGIPFPLYEAPVSPSDDSDYIGIGTCSICGTANAHCFRLGIPADLVVSCLSCGTRNGVDVDDRAAVECRACGAVVPYPLDVAAKSEPKSCYDCLRSGKVAIAKDTEFGMVSWNEVLSGVTNGVPGLRQEQFESVVVDPAEDWIGVRLPAVILFELVRTPTYGSWQGECWLFCCRYPMTFLGEWHQEQFERQAAGGSGDELYYAVVEGVPQGTWDAVGHALSAYVFGCKRCGKLRGHFDFD